jgi:hypothetical protein
MTGQWRRGKATEDQEAHSLRLAKFGNKDITLLVLSCVMIASGDIRGQTPPVQCMLCNLQNHNAATIGDLMFWKDGAVPSSWCSRNAIKPCLCTTLVRRAFMQEQTSMKNKYAWHLLAWLGTLLRIQSSEHYIASERINSCIWQTKL